MSYFTDPRKCSCCQNRGHFDEYLINGECHRCNVRSILSACIQSNLLRGNLDLAITQLRQRGF